MISKITVEIVGGTNLQDVIQVAKTLIKDYKCTYEFDFNSVHIILTSKCLEYSNDKIIDLVFNEMNRPRQVSL